MSKEQDAKVLELRTALLKRKEALLGSDKPVYSTSGLFRPDQYSQRNVINIKSSGKGELITATVSLNARMAAAKVLGIEVQSHLGYTTEQWITDFRTRIGVLDRNDNLAEVAKLEAVLEPLLTLKQKRQIGVDDLIDQVAAATGAE